jgi:hypothetical protein
MNRPSVIAGRQAAKRQLLTAAQKEKKEENTAKAQEAQAQAPITDRGGVNYRGAAVMVKSAGVTRVSAATLLLAILLTANAIVPLAVGGGREGMDGGGGDRPERDEFVRAGVTIALALAGLLAVHLLSDRPAEAWVCVVLPLWILSVARQRRWNASG